MLSKAHVPQAPTHCFNDAAEDVTYVGLKQWSGKDQAITVGGPFIHYTEDNAREDKPLVPRTFNIKLEEEHSVGDIYSLLDGELRREVDGKKRMEKLLKNNARILSTTSGSYRRRVG
jgi:hypothetical protein